LPGITPTHPPRLFDHRQCQRVRPLAP
jgi:hypothetical protein